MVATNAFKGSGKKSEDIENPVFPAQTTIEIDQKSSSAFDDTPKPDGLFEVTMEEVHKSKIFENTPSEKEKLWRIIMTYTLFSVYSFVHHSRFRGYTNLYIFPCTMFTYWNILTFHLYFSWFLWGGFCGVVMVLVALVSGFCFGGGFVQQSFQSLRVLKNGLCVMLACLTAMAVLAWAAVCFSEYTGIFFTLQLIFTITLIYGYNKFSNKHARMFIEVNSSMCFSFRFLIIMFSMTHHYFMAATLGFSSKLRANQMSWIYCWTLIIASFIISIDLINVWNSDSYTLRMHCQTKKEYDNQPKLTFYKETKESSEEESCDHQKY